MNDRVTSSRLVAALAAFIRWLQATGYSSYDQYDLWATRYGIWSKGMYYRHGKSAAALVAPILAVDWLWPESRRWLGARRRFPIADAHYLMGFAALYRTTHEAPHLAVALALTEDLLASSIPGFSGPCWGYPFDWQTRRGLWKRNTPLVTTTPYVFDAFVQMHALTGASEHHQIAASIAQFVYADIRNTAVGGGHAAAYTPFDSSQVVNASTYRAACLAEASLLDTLPVEAAHAYRESAAANVRFVLGQQHEDGSWPYCADDPQDQFVDHFHTCFVLEGLYRAYRALGDANILRAVKRGYAYYTEHLFYPDGRPRPFAPTESMRLRALELYDHAEALKLALLLRKDLPTDSLADAMAQQLLQLQTAEGFFLTRIASGGRRNRVPYHRWAQAQAFCALALYYEQMARVAS